MVLRPSHQHSSDHSFIVVWDRLSPGTPKTTLAFHGVLTTAQFADPHEFVILGGGENGVIAAWDLRKGNPTLPKIQVSFSLSLSESMKDILQVCGVQPSSPTCDTSALWEPGPESQTKIISLWSNGDGDDSNLSHQVVAIDDRGVLTVWTLSYEVSSVLALHLF